MKAPDNHSHVVRPDNMEWQKTRFEGCEVKNLMFDKKSGMATALMRLAPGAVLPDHQHVGIEQTWVIEGSLGAGLAVGPGEFVWREAGSRHSAWCPDGGVMLAIFQVPNKFFDEQGCVKDLAGQDWQAAWGHAVKA